MALSESLRQAYLKAIGVNCWFPSKVLPYAKPARSFTHVANLSNNTLPKQKSTKDSIVKEAVPIAEKSTLLATPNIKKTKTLFNSDPKPKSSIKQKAHKNKLHDAPNIATNQENKNNAISHFRLTALSANQECLVVTDMPHANETHQFTHFHTELLQKILNSIHQNLEPSGHKSEFYWPLGRQGLLLSMNQDDQAARSAVHGYLKNQFGIHKRALILLLGPMAARFVINPNMSFESLKGIHSRISNQQLVAVSFSIHELLQQPSLKSEFWNDIKPLLTLQYQKNTNRPVQT